jgi:hypothetical protein
MKVQRRGVARVSAQSTSSACLRDERPLKSLTPSGDRVRPAALTAVGATTLEDEFGFAMVWAVVHDGRWLSIGPDMPIRSMARRAESELCHPVTHRGRADIERLRDRTDGQSPGNEGLQLLLSESAKRRVFLPTISDKAVLVDPVADHRRVTVHERTDLWQR